MACMAPSLLLDWGEGWQASRVMEMLLLLLHIAGHAGRIIFLVSRLVDGLVGVRGLQVTLA